MAKTQTYYEYNSYKSEDLGTDLKSDETKLELYDGIEEHVKGEITVHDTRNNAKLGELGFNSLDEPIKETILRDVKIIGIKFFCVLFPRERKTLLKEWDLWGPLVICTIMAMILQGSRVDNLNDGGPEFAEVFVIVWIGSLIVTLNSKLLGGHISFFQSICVLGYCLLPTALALVICRIILFMEQTYTLFFLRFTVTIVGYGWALYASIMFLGDSQKSGRKALAVYPLCLFYFIISWLVISHTNI